MKSEYNRKSEREAVLDILLNVLEEGIFSGNALDRELNRQSRSTESRAFITRLTEGTIERLITIDDVLDSCASVPCRKMKPVIRNILRESVYQMLFMDNVADAVAVNDAVALAKKRGFAGLAKFVNGVLRTVGRKKESFSFYTGKEVKPGSGNTSVFYSMPLWLVRHMESAAGRDRAEAVFKDFLTVRPLQARVNLTNADKRNVMESLTAEGLQVWEHPYLDHVILLESAFRLTRTEAFREGQIQIQDASSVLAVAAAGIRPGMRVLDVCAAPGGKSLYAADLLCDAKKCGNSTDDSGEEKRGDSIDERAAVRRGANSLTEGVSPEKMSAHSSIVRSRDLTDAKVAKIRENAARCHFDDIIRPEVADAKVFDPGLEAWADVVIADLPCSGLGVIAKKPDIKYRVQPEDLTNLAALQREILSVVWRYVKPGGVLIYSTCTVSPKENQENVRWFLSQGYPMEADDMTPYLPERFLKEVYQRRSMEGSSLKQNKAGSGQGENAEKPKPAQQAMEKTDPKRAVKEPDTAVMNQSRDRVEPTRAEKITELQLLPGEYETDGFFIARFRRNPDQEHERL
ncbi:MAG: 16S rRNA (cytosine(967)-C(5))-methyltransferase [Lachnospiraceae bacterium]|nr:16S rRNA (cytosine(967)-C(5))-methyltransferase [Lachnospiraceae bacterium]